MSGKLNPGASSFVPEGNGTSLSQSAAQGDTKSTLASQQIDHGSDSAHSVQSSSHHQQDSGQRHGSTVGDAESSRQYSINTLLDMKPRKYPPKPEEFPSIGTVQTPKVLLESNLTPNQLTHLFAQHPSFQNGIPSDLPHQKVFQAIAKADNVPFILSSNPMWKSYIKEISVHLRRRIAQTNSKKQSGKRTNGENTAQPAVEDISRALLQTAQLYDSNYGETLGGMRPSTHSSPSSAHVGGVPPGTEPVKMASEQLVGKLPYQPTDMLAKEFISFAETAFTGPLCLETVVNTIFQKALNTPTYCELCSRLSAQLVGSLPEFLEGGRLCSFRKFLLMRCYRIIVTLGSSSSADTSTHIQNSFHERLQLSPLSNSRKQLHSLGSSGPRRTAMNQPVKVGYPYPFYNRSVAPTKDKRQTQGTPSSLWSTTMASDVSALGDSGNNSPEFTLDDMENSRLYNAQEAGNRTRSSSEDQRSSGFPPLSKERKTEERYAMFLAYLYRYQLITENLIRMALSRLLDPPLPSARALSTSHLNNVQDRCYIPTCIPGGPSIEAACELLLCVGDRLDYSGHAAHNAVTEYVDFLNCLVEMDDRGKNAESVLSVRARHKIAQVNTARRNNWSSGLSKTRSQHQVSRRHSSSAGDNTDTNR